MALSLGTDVGTTAIKVTLIDVKTLEILAVNREDHGRESTVSTSSSADWPNFHEQDPLCILKSVDKCLKGISSSILNKVSLITVAGQMHGMLCWSNSRFKASMKKQLETKQISMLNFCDRLEIFNSFVTNLITWQDGRCDAEFLSSLPKCSCPVSTGFGCASLFWLQKNNPEFLQNYDCAGSIMDFLVYLLCALDKSFMSPQIAHSWGYFDVQNNKWEYQVLSKENFPVSLLPKIMNVGECVGFLGFDLHGVAKGTRMNISVGDFQCSMLACCKNETCAVLNLGTSAQLASLIPNNCEISSMQQKYPAVQVFPYFKNLKVAVAASLNGGNTVDAFIGMLCSWFEDLGVAVPNSAHFYAKFQEFCAEETCSSELQIKPTLLGERHFPTLLASVTRISKENLQLGNVVRQLYKGIIENIFDMMPYECLKMLRVMEIIGTGSVLVNNDCISKLVEKVSKFPCQVAHNADASYGAAIACL